MLTLVGLGLRDGDIAQRGIDAVAAADAVYAEFYTNTIDYDLAALEAETGQGVEVLDRAAVEQEDRVLADAEDRDVVFLVSGDPLAATTHQDLLFRARQQGIDTAVVHAPSIFTAVAETGLSLYRFGRATTLTVQGGEVPGSVVEIIEDNREQGLHTLVLIDPDMAVPGPMEHLSRHVDRDVVLCSRLGTADATMRYAAPDELSLAEDMRPATVVVPGELTDNERERLALLG
ncbi:MAG: diphthine synthase [Candidatus Nanohaloarchaea archaeon]|nr:diphthine synthase [Candidatus Nanohaloarchaea archaeon]